MIDTEQLQGFAVQTFPINLHLMQRWDGLKSLPHRWTQMELYGGGLGPQQKK